MSLDGTDRGARRLPPLMLIEAEPLLSPLIDEDESFNGIHYLGDSLRDWAKGSVLVVFPPTEVSSRHTLSFRDRLALSGISIAIRVQTYSGDERARTRMLWHVCGERKPEGELNVHLRADRVHRFPVPIGDNVPWESLDETIKQYGALMAFPSSE